MNTASILWCCPSTRGVVRASVQRCHNAYLPCKRTGPMPDGHLNCDVDPGVARGTDIGRPDACCTRHEQLISAGPQHEGPLSHNYLHGNGFGCLTREIGFAVSDNYDPNSKSSIQLSQAHLMCRRPHLEEISLTTSSVRASTYVSGPMQL